jgi:murein DD-endopeptidase MepM/ murein hydrolase activator NlpD
MARIVASVAFFALCLTAQPAAAGDGSWLWPVDRPGGGPPSLAGEFDAPDTPYGPGHRGIDLPTLVGAPVRAVAGGTVTFAGSVAGTDVITIDHGIERSTYQPASARIVVGDAVDAGEVIGTVVLGRFHCASPCLHLGRIAEDGDRYLDPLDRLSGRSRVRLVDPDGAPPVPPVGSAGSGILLRPTAGPVTSPFGSRDHPATGEESFHDGIDFGAACGVPVHAAASGIVVDVARSGAYGLQVVIRHGGGLTTSYGHLADATVDVGDRVDQASVIGTVGSTGLSTGCHVHFGVRRADQPVDPLTLL